MCESFHGLCYGRVQSCVIHNSFPSYDGDVIPACRADCQQAEALSNLITQNRSSLHVFEGGGGGIQYFSVSAYAPHF